MLIKSIFKTSLFTCFMLSLSLGIANAQFGSNDIDVGDDDLTADGGDIFNDFNEDVEAAQVLEDERFYRYGRFFAFGIGLGFTTFTGNRGSVYQDDHPTFNLFTQFFMSFRVAFTLGLAFSKHAFFIDEQTREFRNSAVGAVEANMFRTYFGIRYYIDTADLGTAITWSNPYVTARLEYWYLTNKFINQPTVDDDSGGGLGFGLGGGLEFPLVIKEYYINLEMLWHTVNYHDKFTQAYREVLEDLDGNALTLTANFVINW